MPFTFALGGLGGLFALCAVVFLIIVSVGVPLYKNVDLLSIKWYGSQILLGTWGYCVQNSGEREFCSRSSIGYNADFRLLRVETSEAFNVLAIPDNLTAGFILHPIAAFLAAVAFGFSLEPRCVVHILGSLVAFQAFIVAFFAFWWDLGVLLDAKHRFEAAGAPSQWGIAFWLTLAAVFALLFAAMTICCTGIRHKQHVREVIEEQREEEIMTERS